MVSAALVETEYTHGCVGGTDYGSRVRVLMRSPKAVLYIARGLILHSPREKDHSYAFTELLSGRVKAALVRDPEIAARIDAAFGEGAAGAAAQALEARGMGTALLDGGGSPLILPGAQLREKTQAEYAAATCNWKADLTGEVKTCRQCGAALDLDTDRYWVGEAIQPDHPRSAEDCQRLTNRRVVSINDYGIQRPDRYGYVAYFDVWDGESYAKVDFCSDKCAATYGRRAVRERELLDPGGEAYKPPRRPSESVQLHPDPPRYFTLGDGSKIKY
ncbi:hypothetical protein KIKIMORA_01900 [Brevundimonas phage vB_BpoS-Kikimora]|uniref:Uncharacterized protein n=1 Tax=Brevundimonas phage vB_BpoS-Kikimora TaxID=2948601 RepID=A0A9E7MTG1_9CAUD|nr:hypothetical protein KIKIMORA_01900 [Brevundimonas phage vB_BpoS-Kikimora]